MIQRFFINKELDLLEFEAVNEWGYPKHRHNFYELTYILKGSGQHVLNDNIIDYREGDIFLLTPKDEHEFIVDQPSKFGIIKFTEQFFIEKCSFTSNTHWRKNLKTVIFHSNIIAESIICHDADRDQLFGLYQLIKNELNTKSLYSRNVLTELFGALLIVLSRNLKSSLKEKKGLYYSDREKVNSMLTYIRQNVLDKELVKISTIAKEFNMSPNYVGLFIKKHIGISMQHYLIQTKMAMAEKLLKQSDLNIKEISNKLGFVDTSHFNRTFKKYKGINPSQFKT